MSAHAHPHADGSADTTAAPPSSPYAMLDVSTALSLVLSSLSPLPTVDVPTLSPSLPSSVLASDVLSPSDFPPFRASYMDGYAVVTPCPAGVYPITQRCTAGSLSTTPLLPHQVAYITTGSPLPPNADAICIVEHSVPLPGDPPRVRLLHDTPPHQHVRPIGSDVRKGQLLLPSRTPLHAAEVALLTSLSIRSVPTRRRPVIGVLSTGNELIDPATAFSSSPSSPSSPTSPIPPGCIVDSNRVMVRTLLTQLTHAEVVDLGIAQDDLSTLQSLLSPSLLSRLDALVTTGGVSMGDLDVIKAHLARSADVRFGRVAMKPGKPTTFALLPKEGGGGLGGEGGGAGDDVAVFALPGNPVSAFVCCHLFVVPAVWRMEGREVRLDDHGYVKCRVRCVGGVQRNSSRLEYHRAMVYWDTKRAELIGLSTGQQTSSRLLSAVRCNALLIIEPGAVHVDAGSLVDALLIAPLEPIAPSTLSQLVQAARHAQPSAHQHHHHHHTHSHRHSGETASSPMGSATATAAEGSTSPPFEVRVAVITVSDRCHAGTAEDHSGVSHWTPSPLPLLAPSQPSTHPLCLVSPLVSVLSQPAIERMLTDPTLLPAPPAVTFRVVYRAVVPDEVKAVQELVLRLVDDPSYPPHLLLTTGGTGLAPRDVTPDALAPLLPRPAPGLVHLLLASSLTTSPLGPLTLLSRPVAGVRHNTLCITLPGSTAGVQENLTALLPVLPHALQLIAGQPTLHTEPTAAAGYTS